MQLYNSYYWFKNVFSPDECEEIIELGLYDIKKTKEEGGNISGTVHGGIHKGSNKKFKGAKGDKTTQELAQDPNYNEDDLYVRDSKVGWLNEEWINEKIQRRVQEANEKTTWNWQWDSMETTQFTVYEKGGFYGWHSDGDSDWRAAYRKYIPGVTQKEKGLNYTTTHWQIGKVRKISVTINLSPENTYKGGLLKFDWGPHAQTRFHECTEIKDQGSMIVFPSFQYHQVTPVTEGTRYSLVAWITGRPFQ